MKGGVIFLAAMGMIAGAGRACAQVVHLPTFQFFGISTTVSVPDRGGAYLGGVSRSASGRMERGLPFAGRPFGNRAVASSSQASGVSVSASIHDFESMEQALLDQSSLAKTRTVAGSTPRRGSIESAGRTSVAALRRQQAAQQAAQSASEQAQARADFRRAGELIQQGKAGAAKVYLQHAARRADPELRAEIVRTIGRLQVAAPLAQTSTRD